MSVGHVVIDGENQQILGRPRKYVQLVHKISEICQSFCHTHLSELKSMHRKRDGCITLKIPTAEMLIENAHFIQEMLILSRKCQSSLIAS